MHNRLLRGDTAAFAEVYGGLNPNLMRVAMSITGNRATAEDVAQETWLAVIEKLPTFNGDAPLRHWILRILSNKARTRATRDGRTIPLEPANSDAGERFTSSGDWAVAPTLWDEITPERLLAGRQSWDLVQRAIGQLSEAQQAVLSLHEQENLSAAVCAEILGMSAGNVRVQLHRAREKIRQILDGEIAPKKNCNKRPVHESLL